MGIADSRQCPICRARDGVIRPANDPWWKLNWPPYHFNCCCYVRPVSKEEAQIFRIRPTPPSKLERIPAPLEGFGVDPLVSESFWRMTPSMVERARRYGIVREIKALARWLGIVHVVMPEAVEAEAPVVIGGASVKEGDVVPKWEGATETTVVEKTYADLWGNYVWITGFTLEHVKERGINESFVGEMVPEVLQDPDLVLLDREENAYIYVRVGDDAFWCLMVGKDSGKVFTLFSRNRIFRSKRYLLVYRKGAGQ